MHMLSETLVCCPIAADLSLSASGEDYYESSSRTLDLYS